MTKQEVWTIVREVAVEHGLDPYLVLAIVEQESAYDTKARRLEQRFYLKYAKPMEYDEVTEVLLSVSWGLMQTMGLSLYETNYFGKLDAVSVAKAIQDYLDDPKAQIVMGCRYFLTKLNRANGDITKALLYWNGGADYPLQVKARLARLKKEGLY